MLNVLSYYGVVTLFYFVIRFILHRLNKPYTNEIKKSFTIIIPVYKEDPNRFEECLNSCIKHLDGASEIIVVHDGYMDECYKIASKYACKNSKIIVEHHKTNEGKRKAQATALKYAKGEIIVTVDSDTILHKNTIKELLKPFQDGKIAGVTGLIQVKNRSDNLLTKLLNIRYFMAGVFDRSSYSYYKVVNCTAGPLSAYRKSVFSEVLPYYLNQTHRGKRCTFGDDRCLTNLILRKGYGVFYQRRATCETYAPNSLKTWLKQQLRWNRSFWRESWLALHWCWGRSKYLSLGITLDCALPILFLINLFLAIYQGIITLSFFIIIPYLATAIGIAFLRNFDYLQLTHRKDYFLAPFYVLLYIFFLLPITIYALFTTNNTSWMTR